MAVRAVDSVFERLRSAVGVRVHVRTGIAVVFPVSSVAVVDTEAVATAAFRQRPAEDVAAVDRVDERTAVEFGRVIGCTGDVDRAIDDCIALNALDYFGFESFGLRMMN